MFERLAFVVWMVLTSVSIGVVCMSPWFAWPSPGLAVFLAGAGGCILAWLFGTYGRASLHFSECEASFEFNEAPGVIPEDEEPSDHLRRVFDSWEELDARRDRGDGDIWQVQELRREAASLLRADPHLREEFAHELSRHPELGDRQDR
jgi:hypothetical protein